MTSRSTIRARGPSPRASGARCFASRSTRARAAAGGPRRRPPLPRPAGRRASPHAASAPATLAPGQHALIAPIPGVIATLVATVGQVVQRGDELLTIEAMKMFNVIRSPWAGTVAAVHVTEGKQVAQGEPLVTFVVT